MTNFHKVEDERFDNFMLDEYGKWKVGRAEAKEWIKAHDSRLLEEVVRVAEEIAIEKELMPGKYKSKIIHLTDLITTLKEKIG
jgi:hypothetical protein